MAYNVSAAEQHRAKLRLSDSFGEPELRKAYQRLISKWHPDRFTEGSEEHAEATENMKTINVAYEFLSEVLESNGGTYCVKAAHQAPSAWSWTDLQPRRTYEGKTYTAGFPDLDVIEIFLRSSHIISAGYNRSTQTLYIKFSGNTVYRYFGVPQSVVDAFLDAPSHGKFGNTHIYPRYRQERC